MPSPALIDLSKLFTEGSFKKKLFKIVQKPLETALKVSNCNDVYDQIQAKTGKPGSPDGANFFDTALAELGVQYNIKSGSTSSIPATGPVFVVANHPFGGVDGLILGSILLSQRSDSKILANFLLGKLPEIVPYLIPVNPFGGKAAMRENLKGLREAGQWLADENCLATFPAGIVSHVQKGTKSIQDSTWHANIARLARKHGATIVPLHFSGGNSKPFYRSGLIHPRLRTGMLVRELFNKSSQEIEVRMGTPIPPSQFKDHQSDKDLARYFQMRCEILKHQEMETPATEAPATEPVVFEEIAERNPVEKLIEDIENLPESALILEKGKFKVYAAEAPEIPHILEEIGRTRELTFRAVGEGVGRPLDLDKYDQHYRHIFLWHSEANEIVGAYRIAMVDVVLASHGIEGLYTSNVFDYSDDAFDSLDDGKTVELGRSYIVPSYQRRGTSLFLLWRAIIQHVKKNGYTKLFGAVSISDDYHPLSKGLIMRYLRHNKFQTGFANKMRARKKPHYEKMRSLKSFDYPEALPSLENVSGLVSELEADKKGVPTLIKHYLQLNGVILGFGVDASFSDALDGFILVDLEKVNPTVLKKYEGK
ncbi:lysophospholipid acyltransferase family protein [Akkermansiaceae bacterium]|nr:lysophospholipid acyltransferase family protein [Akkermansiaceae bacterium]